MGGSGVSRTRGWNSGGPAGLLAATGHYLGQESAEELAWEEAQVWKEPGEWAREVAWVWAQAWS